MGLIASKGRDRLSDAGGVWLRTGAGHGAGNQLNARPCDASEEVARFPFPQVELLIRDLTIISRVVQCSGECARTACATDTFMRADANDTRAECLRREVGVWKYLEVWGTAEGEWHG